MINLIQVTVSIGFSIRRGAKVRNLVAYSACGIYVCGSVANKKLKIDVNDLTNTTKWYSLNLKSFTQNKSTHPNKIRRKK